MSPTTSYQNVLHFTEHGWWLEAVEVKIPTHEEEVAERVASMKRGDASCEIWPNVEHEPGSCIECDARRALAAEAAIL